MIFGHHTPAQLPRIKQITESIPRSGKKSLFIAELGSIHYREFRMLYDGTPAVRNAEECVATGKVNERFRDDVARFIKAVADEMLWQELKERTAPKRKFGRIKGKGKKAKSRKKKPKPIPRIQLVKIGEQRFQLALLLMAKLAGYEVSTENLSTQSVLNNWISAGHERDFSLYWTNAEPLDFKFQTLVNVTRTRYRFMQLHQLERDNSFSQRLMSEAEEFEPVVVQRGIAHKGFYQREMPGINIHTHSELRFEEQVLFEGVSADNLTDVHLAQIMKDMLFRLMASNTDISFNKSAQLVAKLPDDLTELEEFFIRYNKEFRRYLSPNRVFQNILRSLR
jgi:hypothetical protein